MEYNSTWQPEYSAPPPPPSSYHHHLNPNPNPNPNLAYQLPPAANEAGPLLPLHHPPPPTANPYSPHGGYSFSHHLSAGPTPPPYCHSVAASAGGGRVGETSWFPAVDSTGQYGSPAAVGYGPLVPPKPSNGLGALVPPPALPAHWRTLSYPGGTKKRSKRTTKVVQSAYCEVCKVNCTCEQDLNSHKQGKKHIKQLQKLLRESFTPKSVEVKEATVASKENVVATDEKKRKKAMPATEEDLETKKRKMLECGAAPDDVRVCTICHIVVNSKAVYDTHAAGQKHIANMKKQQQQQQQQQEAVAVVASKENVVPTDEKKRKKAMPTTEEDLETKKRKMLECGAAPDDMRVCTICHVVVNSKAVYDTHVAGQKHIANMKQQQQQQQQQQEAVAVVS